MAEAATRRTTELHVRAVVLPGAVEQDLYVAGGCYASANRTGRRRCTPAGTRSPAWSTCTTTSPCAARPLAAAAGVRLLAGSDAGQHPHGTVAGQAQLLHAAGVPAEDALAATSWDARTYLGLPGIQAGAPADFVVYASDPRTDLETLDHPELIVLDGQVIPTRT